MAEYEIIVVCTQVHRVYVEAEYEIIVVCTQVHRVYVEAEDDETAQELARDAFGAGEAEPLRDEVSFTIDNVYE